MSDKRTKREKCGKKHLGECVYLQKKLYLAVVKSYLDAFVVMKRFIILFAISLFLSYCVSAQNTSASDNTSSMSPSAPMVTLPKTDWLPEFNKVSVSGPMYIIFKKVASAEEAKIVYDTKGSATSRFRAAVNKNGVLQISERFDSKTTLVTDVTVYYVALDDIKIDHATATFAEPLTGTLLDVVVSGGAIVTMSVDVLDMFVECTGKSAIKLGGSSRYFKLNVSTAHIDAQPLKTVSSDVNASHGAEVYLSVEERLEAVTSTSAKLYYKGSPAILRNRNSLFGGEIAPVK